MVSLRLRHFALICPLAIGSAALAEEATTGHDMGAMVMPGAVDTADAAPSTQAYVAASRQMHTAMNVPYTGDADVDFIRSMIPHHEGAIAMAKVAMEYGADPQVRKLAEEVLRTQQAEVDWMKDWLAKRTGE